MVCFEKFFSYSIALEGVPRSWLVYQFFERTSLKINQLYWNLSAVRYSNQCVQVDFWLQFCFFSIWPKSRYRWCGFSKSILAWFAITRNWAWWSDNAVTILPEVKEESKKLLKILSVRLLDLAVILVGPVIWGRRRLECMVSKKSEISWLLS